MVLTQEGPGGQGSEPALPSWAPNPDPAKDRQCSESITITNPGTISINFQ
jgi:hypothetical protein